MAMWNPWRGCHRCSDGCKYCYIHKGDAKRGINTELIEKGRNFYSPIEKYVRGEKAGQYKIPGGELVYVCFQSVFLIEEADSWREECWKIMKERFDVQFLFLTKRIERFEKCVPDDWGDGYDNVIVGCTVCNQNDIDHKLSIFDRLPIEHKYIIIQPMLESVDVSAHLDGIELVEVGGKSDRNARVLNYDWVLDVRKQCLDAKVKFIFRQCGSHFLKDGMMYNLNSYQLMPQAKKANIDT